MFWACPSVEPPSSLTLRADSSREAASPGPEHALRVQVWTGSLPHTAGYQGYSGGYCGSFHGDGICRLQRAQRVQRATGLLAMVGKTTCQCRVEDSGRT